MLLRHVLGRLTQLALAARKRRKHVSESQRMCMHPYTYVHVYVCMCICGCVCVPDIPFVIHAPLHKAAFCIFVSCLRCFEDKEGIFYLLYYLFLIYDVCLLGGMVEKCLF